MFDSNGFVREIESLARLDADAVHAYTAAIDRIDLADVKTQLILFRGDHERHIADLAVVIKRLGGREPSRARDFKGFVIQGFTAIRSMLGNEAALKAMKGNEELTNEAYAKALESEMPQYIRDVIQRNRDDERRHLQYVQKCIDERVWETHGSVAA